MHDKRVNLLSVRVDVPEHYRSLACWAVECLLEPLRVRARFEIESDTEPDIYYGTHSETVAAAVKLAISPRAADFFEKRDAYDPRTATWRNWEGEAWPVFFADERGQPDLVANTVLVLSGWQEVTTPARDEHGRIRFADSLQAHLGFTRKPVVDAYREWLNEKLLTAGLRTTRRMWGVSDWAMCATIDIDYARKWRPGMVYRELVEYLLMNGRRVGAAERVKRFGAFVSDLTRPGDVYRESLDYILAGLSSRNVEGTLFIKAGAHGPNDVGYSLQHKALSDRLEGAVGAGNEIGLHPSYYASNHARYLTQERDRLTRAANGSPKTVRQHYLRYELPTTLRLHEAAGFRIDSSLGFAEHEGFRRGTCLPFRLFDVHRDRATTVWEMPLLVMDGTLFNRRNYSIEEAIEATKSILMRCRRFGGCGVVLWHEVICDKLDAPGWFRHFDETLDYAVQNGAMVTGLSAALDAWSGSG